MGTFSSDRWKNDLKNKQNIYVQNIYTKSPANVEITWGQCPHVPKENGGLRGGLRDQGLQESAGSVKKRVREMKSGGRWVVRIERL